MADFSPVAPLIGGGLIGLAAALLLLFQGRIAGISGVLGGLIRPVRGETRWRLSFLFGLLLGGVVLGFAAPEALAFQTNRTLGMMAVAGLLVGFGTRLGNGCTSGHGVCGLARMSPRSLVAVVTFMTTGVITAVVVGNLMGGA